MIEIIPAILTESGEELLRLVHMFERAGIRRAHLDICDGFFVPSRTISGHDELRRISTNLIFDVHLMVRNPDVQFERWCDIASADRFLMHIETVPQIEATAGRVHACGKHLGVVVNPESKDEGVEAAIPHADCVQFMTVHPGQQGRSFVPEALERVRAFHGRHPHVPILVDGGVTPVTAPACVEAGASMLVSGSYIVRAADVSVAMRQLEASVIQ
jgi:ribulose-phosphate 3-epimerase